MTTKEEIESLKQRVAQLEAQKIIMVEKIVYVPQYIYQPYYNQQPYWNQTIFGKHYLDGSSNVC